MAEHPYFTRSKDSKDCFSDQYLAKGIEKVVENVENTNLTEITVNDPIIAEQNKLIAQLFQQIAEMRAEMDKTQDLMNLAIVVNIPTLDNERPPFHFPTSNLISESFPNNSSITMNPKPPIIDLTTLNPHHASFLLQKLSTPQIPTFSRIFLRSIKPLLKLSKIHLPLNPFL